MSTVAPEQWGFLSGRVAALEGRFIRDDVMQRMAALEDLNDVFLAVSDTPYKEVFPIIEKLYEADSIITGVYRARLAEMAGNAPQPEVIGMLTAADMFRDFKSFLKNKLAGMQIPRGNGAAMPDVTWQRVLDGLKTDLPEFWSNAAATIRREGEAQPGLLPQTIDLVLDSEYLIQQAATAQSVGYPLIIEWAELELLTRGVEIIWRARTGGYDMPRLRKLFLRGELDTPLLRELIDLPVADWPDRLRPSRLGPIVDDVFSRPEAERLTRYAKRCQDLVLGRLKAAKSVTFGPDRVFGYLHGLRIETWNLRLILAGKVNKISTKLLQARLREQYV